VTEVIVLKLLFVFQQNQLFLSISYLPYYIRLMQILTKLHTHCQFLLNVIVITNSNYRNNSICVLSVHSSRMLRLKRRLRVKSIQNWSQWLL